MYERFTDRARKTMQLANQAAQGMNHEFIDTGDILIGLCKVTGSKATAILESLGIDTVRIICAVTESLERGPDMVTMGKLPQTPRAKKVIEYAMEESRDLGHNYVGTEHLLLGCLREAEGVAATVLGRFSVTIGNVRTHLVAMQMKPKSTTEMEQFSSLTSEEVTVCQHLVAAYHAFAELEPSESDKLMFMNGLRAMKMAVSGRILDRCWPEVWNRKDNQ